MASKYETIRHELYRRLQDGVYAVGSRLPTDHQLAAEFGVNRHTVRRAISFLVDAGCVERRPRRGTTVRARPGAGKRGGSIRILYRYFGSGDTARCLQTAAACRMVEQFTRLNPHIEIVPVPSPPGLAPDAPSGPSPTLHAVVSRFTYVADMAQRDGLLALDDFDDWTDVALPLQDRLIYRTANSSGNRAVHALPVQLSSWMMLVNQSLLKGLGVALPGAPLDWEGFLDFSRAIGQRGESRGTRGVCQDIVGQNQFVTRYLPFFFTANGHRPVIDADSGEVSLASPGNEACLEFFRRLYEENLCHVDSSIQSFYEKRCAIRLSVVPMSVRQAMSRMPAAQLEPVPLPLAYKSATPATVLRGEFVGIMATPRHDRRERRAAWEFVKYLLSPDAQEIAFRTAQMLPARKDMVGVVSTSDEPERTFLEYGLRCGLPTFDVPGNAYVHRLIQSAIIRAMIGECSPRQALTEAQARIVEHLALARKGAPVDHSLVS